MPFATSVPKNYINLYEIAKLEGIPKGTIASAISTGVVGIATITAIKPIGHLFREFEKGQRKSYAILRSHYEYWKRTGEAPKVSPGRPQKHEKGIKNYRIVAPPFFPVFESGIKKMNKGRLRPITKQEIIWLFIKEGMERRPQFFDWNDANE
jgi:hypothetical protein